MFNVGGGELLVIFFLALVVLGPTKLPEVARQVGGMMRELRKISSGFQAEMKAAMDDPIEAASRDRGRKIVSSDQRPMPTPGSAVDGDVPEPISTAEAAGMYNLEKAASVADDEQIDDDADPDDNNFDDLDDDDDDDEDNDDEDNDDNDNDDNNNFDDLDDDEDEDDDDDDDGDRR